MFTAKLRYARLSCIKAFLVVNKIRGVSAVHALNILKYSVKKSSRIIRKLLLSAVANACRKGYNIEILYISKIFLDQASSLKRLRLCAKGRSSRILKRSCHITIELSKSIVR